MDKRLERNLNNVQADYVAPFLWMHNEDDNLLLDEIEHIYQGGMRSICLESRPHEEFCREDWFSDVKLIFDECKKRDMKVWILDDKHFPSGYANGIFVEKYKHMQAWGITECHIDVVGPVIESCAMVDDWKTSEEDEIMAIIACKHIPDSSMYYDETIDLTGNLSDGMVYFSLPDGMWRIMFLIKTRSGILEERKPYVDTMNPAAVDLYIDEVYQPHYDKFKEYFGNTFLGFFSDESSMNANTANDLATLPGKPFMHYPWNDRAFKVIEDKYGKDTYKKLAALWVDIDGVSSQVRYDYMDMVTKEYQRNFNGRLAKWCHEHGVMYIGHIIEDNNSHCAIGFSVPHYFRALWDMDMGGIDVVLHQIMPGLTQCSNRGRVEYFHMNYKLNHYVLAKLASSFSHIDPRKKNRAMAEVFGGYGWAEGTKLMKYLIDHMLVRGMNYFVPHAFSPFEDDNDCPPSFYNRGKNAQYKYFKSIMDYTNRMCNLLTDTKHISSCALLYDAENKWVSKEFLPMEDVAKQLYDNLVDYDIVPSEILGNMQGDTLNGEKYSMLLVAYADTIPNEVREKLDNLEIPVIMVANGEKKCDYPSVDISEIARYVKENGFNDVDSDYDGILLRFYHCVRDDVHMYMFNNEDINNTINTKVTLSAFSGGDYVLYDAQTNKACKGNSDNNQISLSIEPYHSVVVMVGNIGADELDGIEEIKIGKEVIIKPYFDISTKKERDTQYTFYKRTDKLENISGKNALPFFGGKIQYKAEFDSPFENCLLDLGFVGEAVDIYVNEQLAGERYTPKYSINISDFVKKGTNTLELIVSTTSAYENRDDFSKYMAFDANGVLGPIKLIEVVK